MSLATRCPVCQTVFRVVQDQLKVSEGWVRCGRCAKVFNAFEGLFDLEREFPALRSAAGGSSTPSQRVLEDLARRNPRPQHGAQWEQEVETRAGVRDMSPQASATLPPAARTGGAQPQPTLPSARALPAAPRASSAPTPTPAAAPAPFRDSAPAPLQSAAPAAFKPSAPAPFKPSVPAPFQPSAPAPFKPSAPSLFKPSAPAPFQTSAPAPFEASAPAQAAVPAPFQPSAPPAFKPSAPAPQAVTTTASQPTTARAAPPREPAAAPPPFRPSVPAANDDATVAPKSPPRPAPAVAAPVPSASVAAAAPSAAAKPAQPPAVNIRDEPAPMAQGAADSGGSTEESFDALFRSDGELAEPATATDDVDIMLDGADVEPASLDDAVDSRLLTFVQLADKAERWRRPWVRATLALSALLLTLLLAAQIAVARRDALVAHWPQSRSLLQALCGPFDCRIEPLRRIELISVDSSGLTRIDDGPVYRLALVLRNRGDTPLLAPAIDLSLTDASGALVSRRMLSPADLGAARNTIAAQQELPLQALLMSADRPLTGYTIEIFYP